MKKTNFIKLLLSLFMVFTITFTTTTSYSRENNTNYQTQLFGVNSPYIEPEEE